MGRKRGKKKDMRFIAQAHQELLGKQLAAERERGETEVMAARQQLEMVQQALQLEQRARKEEQQHQVEMLRELQGLINSERTAKQSLVEKLRETENKMSQLRVTMAEEK